SFDYKWYKKGSLDVVSTQDGIAFCNVESSEYMLELTAEHPSSGLGKKVASEYVSVVISAKEISVQKLEGDYDLSKTYDTTKTFVGDVAKDVHYQLDGIVLGDDVAVESVFAEYVSAQVGNTTLSVTFEGITGADASNYTFSGALLNYDTLISAKAVSLKKLSSPNLNKEYDGTTDVAYAFERGVDFELVGVLEEIECVCSAKYSVASVGESKVVLSVEINNLNYSLSLSTLEFDATIGKKELVPIKLSSPNISKIYDGTKSTFYNFTYAVDFTMSGAIDGEIKSVGYTAFYDSANVIASKVVLIVGEIEFNDGASLDNYEYVSNAYDLYFDASITPREIALSGQDFVREYEESENLVDTIVTGVGAESIKVRYIRESGNVVGEYAYIGVEFVAPVNSNYALKFVPDGKIYKIIPSVPIIVFPTFESRDYSESVTLKDEVLIDDTNYQKETDGYVHKMGVFRWAQPSIVANANDEVGYDMVFAPNDTINYDYSSVEGFDQNTKNVTRKVVLTIFKATPTPTPIADSFVIPIGMRYNKLALGEKWSIVESDLLTSSSVASGEENQTVTFENALVYEHDDSGNYHKVYKDLVVSFVLPKIVFKNGENSAEGNQVEVIRNLNGSIAIRIALQNPFAKEGYKVSEWTLADGTKIYSNGADTQTYDLLSPDLVKLTIAIEVNMVARDDVRVEFRHYYENLSGGYDDENVEVALVFGTANVTRGISYSDLKVKKGFSFTKATLTESEESIENFVVSPSGDTVVLFYYVRKTIMVNYVDTLYCELPHEGALPETKEVKYGVPFGIGQPLNYLVYGYNFVGYTDGVTMEDGALKVISDVEYVVTDDIESVTFTLRLAPSTNTLYIINRYVGDECVSEKHYGTTGASIDITNVEYVGHDRYAHENEKLKGVISGNVVDEDGNVIKGEVLTLAVYYKVESYIITLPSEVDGDFLTAEFGKEIILPSAPEQQEGKEFLGWVINGVLYSAVESFVMPASDVVITARWQDEVADGEGNVGSGAEDESTSTDESESTAEVLSSGAIIGIVAGTAALIVIVAIISAVVTKRQKKRQELIYKLQEVNRNMFND
ncbi:MAG: hypothetical protein IJ033_06010, partial [Clostridia bacterium]|nr:hypothetical protein [Clostridia bacterium]